MKGNNYKKSFFFDKKMKLKSDKLIIFLLIIILFPSLYMGIGNLVVPCYIFAGLGILLIYILSKPMELIAKLVEMYKKTPFKIIICFAIWAFITIFVSIIRHRFLVGGFITSAVGGLIFSVLCPCIIAMLLIPKYIPYKTFIKIFISFCWFVFALALVEFFVFYFNINQLESILSVFSNKRMFYGLQGVEERVFLGSLPRCRSIFDEPSYLGYFILAVSPIILELKQYFKLLYKNKIIGSVVKNTVFPFMYIALLLTQSPIFIIFNALFLVWYFGIYKKKLLQIAIFGIIGVIILLLIISSKGIEETYLNRILLTLQNITSIEDLIMAEPSLATRLIIFSNIILLGIHNPLFGVGLGNMSYLIADFLLKFRLPLTGELIMFAYLNKTTPPSTIFVKIFSETGIIGTVIFYAFLITLLLRLKRILRLVKGYQHQYLTGSCLFIIVYIMSSFYDSNLNQPYIYLLIGCTIKMIYGINIRCRDKLSAQAVTDTH